MITKTKNVLNSLRDTFFGTPFIRFLDELDTSDYFWGNVNGPDPPKLAGLTQG